MSKADDLDRIEASAIALFSRRGFEGTSLRDIAGHAGVTLSRIDRHFGSKQGLLNEVQRRAWLKICADRDELLKTPISRQPNGQPTLEAVLYAFVHPIAERSINGKDLDLIRLIRELQATRMHQGHKCGPEFVIHGATKWIANIRQACPDLDSDCAVWLYSFVVSVTYSAHLTNGWFDNFLSSQRRYTCSEITWLIVSFCKSGIAAATRQGGETSEHAPPAFSKPGWPTLPTHGASAGQALRLAPE